MQAFYKKKQFFIKTLNNKIKTLFIILTMKFFIILNYILLNNATIYV